jgi:hypothetical protein
MRQGVIHSSCLLNAFLEAVTGADVLYQAPEPVAGVGVEVEQQVFSGHRRLLVPRPAAGLWLSLALKAFVEREKR